MEELLSKLIERGWKPFGRKPQCIRKSEQFVGKRVYCGLNYNKRVSLRELVSKESGLWQFVCENGYIKEIETDGLEIRNWDNPKHWIVESALCDEDKLEEFLLNSIKLD